MFWLTKITEDQAKALDSKWKKKVTGIGEVWVTYKKDKFGILKEYARKSAPSYERMRRYLLAQYNVVDELKDMAHRFGFIMPEDDFAIECRMPMPKSWTKKKKIEMAYQLHKQKPDADNAFKLLIDVMFKDGSTSGRFRNDSCVSSFVCVKYYVPDGVDTGYNIIEFEKGFISGIIPNLK
jgi:Holliday junction resolvase RusA-like endonuclease